jgi:hypothetical protein
MISTASVQLRWLPGYLNRFPTSNLRNQSIEKEDEQNKDEMKELLLIPGIAPTLSTRKRMRGNPQRSHLLMLVWTGLALGVILTKVTHPASVSAVGDLILTPVNGASIVPIAKKALWLRPMVGEFKNGRGEFIDQEPVNGNIILVRHVFTDITPDSHHFEQAFSDDGGQNLGTKLCSNVDPTERARVEAE